jgi:ATP/maltotriose-dependent transcriptional regulator MalT
VRLEGTGPAQDGEAAALLLGLARAWAGTTDKGRRLQETVNILSRAFDFYAEAGEVDRAVAVAEYPLSTGYLGRDGHAQFLLRALQLVPPDSLAAGRLLSSHGAELGRLENDYDGAQEALRRALAIARREKDLALEARTLALSANVNLYHLHIREALENARQAIELAPGMEDLQTALLAHMNALRALHHIGESRAALPYGAVALELAQKLRGPTRLAVNYGLNALLYRHLGDFRRARELIRRVIAEAPLDIGILSECVLLEYESGDFDAGAGYLKRFLETAPPAGARPGAQYAFQAQVLPWVARITGVLDRLDAAAAAAQTVLSSPFAIPYYALWSRAGLGLVAVLRGDVAAATEQYEALELSRGVMLWATSSDHVLGLLAHTMGNLDRAVEHFEDTVAFCRKAGYRPALAWSCYDYADLLLSRNRPGDRQQARFLLEEALTVSTDLGMHPLMGRVRALWEQADVQLARIPAYPDGLTHREVEVLRLIALGKSNAEIAEELVIAEGTARRHVNNIYDKIGVSNRVEATRYAMTEGLF